MSRTAIRRLGFGLATVLGLRRLGFFIPYRYADGVKASAYPALEALFAQAQPRFHDVLDQIDAHSPELLAIARGEGPARFDQDWFTALDAAAAYALVRTHGPRRVLEIGSGHSTRFLARAIADAGAPAEIVCIDPAPRAPIEELGVRHLARVIGDEDCGRVADLEANDILFIDSSHVAMPGTDVDRFFLDLLPRVRPGVLIHVHDVLLPDAYPAAWAWRGYNEQIVAGALIQGGAFALVFASHYVRTRLAPRVRQSVVARIASPPGALETSLWLVKR